MKFITRSSRIEWQAIPRRRKGQSLGRASAAIVEVPGFNPRPRHHFSIEWWLSVAKVQGSIPWPQIHL